MKSKVSQREAFRHHSFCIWVRGVWEYIVYCKQELLFQLLPLLCIVSSLPNMFCAFLCYACLRCFANLRSLASLLEVFLFNSTSYDGKLNKRDPVLMSRSKRCNLWNHKPEVTRCTGNDLQTFKKILLITINTC